MICSIRLYTQSSDNSICFSRQHLQPAAAAVALLRPHYCLLLCQWTRARGPSLFIFKIDLFRLVSAGWFRLTFDLKFVQPSLFELQSNHFIPVSQLTVQVVGACVIFFCSCSHDLAVDDRFTFSVPAMPIVGLIKNIIPLENKHCTVLSDLYVSW